MQRRIFVRAGLAGALGVFPLERLFAGPAVYAVSLRNRHDLWLEATLV